MRRGLAEPCRTWTGKPASQTPFNTQCEVSRSQEVIGKPLSGNPRFSARTADGSVEMVAEGPRADLEKLMQAAREGPRSADVTDVDAEWSAASGGLEPFDLTY